MSKKNALGLKDAPSKANAHAGGRRALFQHLQDRSCQSGQSELCAVRRMGDLLELYRRDILRQRREFKKLREQEAAHALANLHLEHRLKELDTTIRRNCESYAELRNDYRVQCESLLNQHN